MTLFRSCIGEEEDEVRENICSSRFLQCIIVAFYIIYFGLVYYTIDCYSNALAKSCTSITVSMGIIGFFLLCFSVYILFWIFYNYNKNPVLPIHNAVSPPKPILLDVPVDTSSMISNPILSKERTRSSSKDSSSSPKLSKKSSKSSRHSSPSLSSSPSPSFQVPIETIQTLKNPMH
jgi:hypothetical protein